MQSPRSITGSWREQSFPNQVIIFQQSKQSPWLRSHQGFVPRTGRCKLRQHKGLRSKSSDQPGSESKFRNPPSVVDCIRCVQWICHTDSGVTSPFSCGCNSLIPEMLPDRGKVCRVHSKVQRIAQVMQVET